MMWQKHNQYSAYHEAEDGLAYMALTLMFVGFLIIYLLSVIMTRLVLHYLINPLLNDRLSEDDQLLLLMSGLSWMVISGVIILPLSLSGQYLSHSQAVEALITALGTAIGFGVWGLLSGFGVLIWMYWEIGSTAAWEPTHGFEAITGLPAENYWPAELETQSKPEMTLSEVEVMLRNDSNPGDMKFEIPIPEDDLPRESPSTPAAVPVPSTNGR